MIDFELENHPEAQATPELIRAFQKYISEMTPLRWEFKGIVEHFGKTYHWYRNKDTGQWSLTPAYRKDVT